MSMELKAAGLYIVSLPPSKSMEDRVPTNQSMDAMHQPITGRDLVSDGPIWAVGGDSASTIATRGDLKGNGRFKLINGNCANVAETQKRFPGLA
ncbi:hypothetical protein FKM82_027007 [Ascaphus truei]